MPSPSLLAEMHVPPATCLKACCGSVWTRTTFPLAFRNEKRQLRFLLMLVQLRLTSMLVVLIHLLLLPPPSLTVTTTANEIVR